MASFPTTAAARAYYDSQINIRPGAINYYQPPQAGRPYIIIDDKPEKPALPKVHKPAVGILALIAAFLFGALVASVAYEIATPENETQVEAK